MEYGSVLYINNIIITIIHGLSSAQEEPFYQSISLADMIIEENLYAPSNGN